ncbi:Retinoblastoma-binding protein 6 [Heterocephalus glaber]|uniref:Retinoblastoma-binding protein 6 n=1 Tax=Heterocephalus glaber TaxID=10181 RepID=G5B8V1_HETGA|nr:Retinoblastoma-binding protein 6 [Heterocephalus glaber]
MSQNKNKKQKKEREREREKEEEEEEEGEGEGEEGEGEGEEGEGEEEEEEGEEEEGEEEEGGGRKGGGRQAGLCTPYQGPESRGRHRITPLQTGSHLVPRYKHAEDTRPPDKGTESRCSRPKAKRKGLLGHLLSRCSRPRGRRFQATIPPTDPSPQARAFGLPSLLLLAAPVPPHPAQRRDDATPVRDEPTDAESITFKSVSEKDKREKDKPKTKGDKTKQKNDRYAVSKKENVVKPAKGPQEKPDGECERSPQSELPLKKAKEETPKTDPAKSSPSSQKDEKIIGTLRKAHSKSGKEHPETKPVKEEKTKKDYSKDVKSEKLTNKEEKAKKSKEKNKPLDSKGEKRKRKTEEKGGDKDFVSSSMQISKLEVPQSKWDKDDFKSEEDIKSTQPIASVEKSSSVIKNVATKPPNTVKYTEKESEPAEKIQKLTKEVSHEIMQHEIEKEQIAGQIDKNAPKPKPQLSYSSRPSSDLTRETDEAAFEPDYNESDNESNVSMKEEETSENICKVLKDKMVEKAKESLDTPAVEQVSIRRSQSQSSPSISPSRSHSPSGSQT